MRKIGLYISMLIVGGSVFGQDLTDGLRLSQTEMNGTARFMALSGAFGALGGDLSAISVNPASSAVFANNQLVLTTTKYGLKNETDYFGQQTTSRTNNFSLNQFGGVFVFKNNDKGTNWKKFAIAINYDKLNDYKSDLVYKGENPTRSIADYFLYYGNQGNNGGIMPLELIQLQSNETVSGLYQYLADLPNNDYNVNSFNAQQAMLGYQSYLLEAVFQKDVNNNDVFVNYKANLAAGRFLQKNTVQNRGYNRKWGINFSGQYGDKLYVGANLNLHFFDYTRSSVFEESNMNGVLQNGITIDRVVFNNNLHTFGNGVSLQFGMIYKVGKPFRLGLSLETPTWLKVSDEFSQSLVTSGYGIGPNYTTVVTNPNFTNKYAPYDFSTPGKVSLSGAYIFGKKGLLSVDYSYKDYSGMAFTPANDFEIVNDNVTKQLGGVNEVKVGGEFKVEKLSLRAGYRFEESPYIDKNVMGDLKGYSAGLGYNFGAVKIDLAYSNAKRSYAYQPFTNGFLDVAKVTKKNDNIALSFVLDF